MVAKRCFPVFCVGLGQYWRALRPGTGRNGRRTLLRRPQTVRFSQGVTVGASLGCLAVPGVERPKGYGFAGPDGVFGWLSRCRASMPAPMFKPSIPDDPWGPPRVWLTPQAIATSANIRNKNFASLDQISPIISQTCKIFVSNICACSYGQRCQPHSWGGPVVVWYTWLEHAPLHARPGAYFPPENTLPYCEPVPFEPARPQDHSGSGWVGRRWPGGPPGGRRGRGVPLARAWTGQWGLEPTNIRLMLERMNIFRPLVFDIAEFSLFFYSHAGRKFWLFGYIVFKKRTGWGRLCGGVNSRGE